jgi:hypothetical protein
MTDRLKGCSAGRNSEPVCFISVNQFDRASGIAGAGKFDRLADAKRSVASQHHSPWNPASIKDQSFDAATRVRPGSLDSGWQNRGVVRAHQVATLQIVKDICHESMFDTP